MKPISLIINASNAVGWSELRAAIDALEGVSVVAALSDITQTGKLVAERQPDVVVAPAAERGASTLPIVTEILQLIRPQARVIIFASQFDPESFFHFVHLGVAGYLLWPDIDADLLVPLASMLIRSDGLYLSATPARTWNEHQHGRAYFLTDPPQLTERERQILKRLAEGMRLEEIAEVEYMSVRTVKRNVSALMVKLDADRQFTLGMKAAMYGLVP